MEKNETNLGDGMILAPAPSANTKSETKGVNSAVVIVIVIVLVLAFIGTMFAIRRKNK